MSGKARAVTGGDGRVLTMHSSDNCRPVNSNDLINAFVNESNKKKPRSTHSYVLAELISLNTFISTIARECFEKFELPLSHEVTVRRYGNGFAKVDLGEYLVFIHKRRYKIREVTATERYARGNK